MLKPWRKPNWLDAGILFDSVYFTSCRYTSRSKIFVSLKYLLEDKSPKISGSAFLAKDNTTDIFHSDNIVVLFVEWLNMSSSACVQCGRNNYRISKEIESFWAMFDLIWERAPKRSFWVEGLIDITGFTLVDTEFAWKWKVYWGIGRIGAECSKT